MMVADSVCSHGTSCEVMETLSKPADELDWCYCVGTHVSMYFILFVQKCLSCQGQ